MIGLEPSGGAGLLYGAVVVAVTIIAQSFAALRWLNGQFAKRDEALAKQKENFEIALLQVREEAVEARQAASDRMTQLEKELLAMKAEVSVRMERFPTRNDLEVMLREKVAPLEQDVRALVIELARHGLVKG